MKKTSSEKSRRTSEQSKTSEDGLLLEGAVRPSSYHLVYGHQLTHWRQRKVCGRHLARQYGLLILWLLGLSVFFVVQRDLWHDALPFGPRASLAAGSAESIR